MAKFDVAPHGDYHRSHAGTIARGVVMLVGVVTAIVTAQAIGADRMAAADGRPPNIVFLMADDLGVVATGDARPTREKLPFLRSFVGIRIARNHVEIPPIAGD